MLLQTGGTPALIESPFTDVNVQGPLGGFPPTEVKLLVGVLTQIRERVVA